MPAQPYSIALLQPSRSPDAETHNEPLLGDTTLGIEVTEPELAARCGLSNLDPQHGRDTPIPGRRPRSAVEAALDWPLPPLGARLVTIRPDADAFGAMAVLSLRAKGIVLDAAARRRVAMIGRCDAFALGDWSRWRTSRGPLPRPAPARQMVCTPAGYAAVTALARDTALTPDARVLAFEAWLLTADIRAYAREANGVFVANLARAWNEGEIDIRCPPPGGLAVVRSAAPGALMLGYRFAPLVAAFSPDLEGGPRKVTIAQFATGHADLAAVAAGLSALEPGWGGTPTIVGSPQGVGSRLPEAVIFECVAKHRT
jgi:hypothetical protein